jgi:hypothetical protein
MRRTNARQQPAAAPWPPAPRSSLIAPLPRHAPRGRVLRIARRALAWAALLAGLTWLARMIRGRLLGDGPLAAALYQAHDSLYLPLKGHTFTRFFPTSLIWYGLAASLFALWLAFFLSDRSLVRRPHLALLRRAVAVGPLRPALVGVARLLLRLGLPPELLRQAAEHERDLAALRVAGGDDTGGRRLAALARLLTDLALLEPDHRLAALRAACDWQQATLLLHARRHPSASALAPHIVAGCARALRTLGTTPCDALAGQPPGLDVSACLTDVLRLALLAGADTASLRAEHDPRLPELTDPASLSRGLLRAAEWRRAQLDGVRAALERAIVRPFAQAAGPRAALALPDAPAEQLACLGRLALGADLAAAYAARSGELAQGALEAIDALSLALALAGPAVPPHLAEPARRARFWVGELPASIDRQLAASLSIDRSTELELAWRQSVSAAGPLRQADLARAEARSADMFRAAGLGHEANLLDTAQDERL